VLAIVIVVWLVQIFYRQAPNLTGNGTQAAGPAPTAAVDVESLPALENPATVGILREAQLHTNVPSRPRQEIVMYTVEKGDSVFGIAEKFGLEAETILWGNYGVLQDDPHLLQPDQELVILPVNGVYWEWLGGIPFGQWAEYYGVTAEDILNYPGNNIDTSGITDYYNANVEIGKWLIIPGGHREFVQTWNAPFISRTDAATARVLGPGFCDPVTGGAIGYGAYVWPTNKHFISGYDYSPKSNHWGVDLAGSEGEGVYAVDAGVIVYSGWNNYGYGNMIMIDHGNGWQSLYAHLSQVYRGCGASVGQGEGIGAIGSTGRSSGAHLHFELMTPGFKVNPWDYLPAP
jgi:murein DD-endopeptidase MepM/ murein hydrolase activator NlpD